MKTFLLLMLMACAAQASAQLQLSQLSEDEAAFRNLAGLYESATDRAAVIDAFQKFVKQYPKSPRAPDARFMQGEAYMAKGLELLRQEKLSKMASDDRMLAGVNPAAIAELNSAAGAYEATIKDYSKSGLEASAQYREGEAYYNMGGWERALKEFLKVEDKYPKSYIVPESLLGAVYANIAMGRYQDAQASLFRLEETFLPYAREPAVVFAKAVIELNRKNYPSAQKLFLQLSTPEARFFLGKAYLYEGKTYMAASVFEKVLKDFPDADFKEEAEFLAADSFFHASDFDGAITKYQNFLKKYPESKLRSAAVFRIGASLFNKKDYPSARSNFQSVIDKNPRDFFAPYAQYFIAESYLENKQTRDALFAYTKVTTGYGASSVAPASAYKLAWCQYVLGDYLQAVHALDSFLILYPSHALAKNAYYLKGTAQLELRKTDDALRSFQNAVDMAPSSDVAEQAMFMILRAEYDRGNFNSMLTSYQFIFKHLPPAGSKWRALSLLYVAEAYMALNLTDDARNIYTTIARIYPNDVSAMYAQDGLVWCLAIAGDTEGAARAREKLKALKTQFADAIQPTGADAMALADSNFNRKEFEKAYQMYEAFAAEQPRDSYAPVALYRAGLALYRLRYYSQAVETWSRLSRDYPKAPETELADFQIADTWFRAQKYAESVGAYEAIIAKYPKSDKLPLAWLRLAQVRYNLKQDAQALEQAKTAVSKYPDAPEAADAFDLAEAAFDRTLSLDFKAWFEDLAARQPADRTSGEATFRLGRRYFEKKDYAAAVAALKKFSVEYIDHASIKDAQFYLGEAYFQTGDMENAAGVFDRFVKNYPEAKEHPVALFRLGNAYYNQKDYEKAAKAYSKLAELYPQSEYIKPALFNMALCYKSTGDSDKAEETYRKYFELTGKGDDALAALWEIFNIQKTRGDLAGALKTLTEIYGESEGKEDGLEAMYYMGEMNADNRQPDEARDYWERLAQQKPAGSPWRLQGLVKLGEMYEAEKNYQEAARVYNDIARNSAKPEVAKAAGERARSLLGMGRQSQTEKMRTLPGMDGGEESVDEAAPGEAPKAGAAAPAKEQAAPAKKKVRRLKKKAAQPAAN
ncbi:MAG: tetratricopeptide repeat protein [Elusimicrobia bacterium]|nr:tetratricopeptide repeat protein [Elusimicrobiota bacterium]